MKFKNIFLLPLIILKAIYFGNKVNKNNLPGQVFAKFGRKLGRIHFLRHKEFIPLLLSPVSIVRYFEFEYIKIQLGGDLENSKILDVSSPYLFSFFVCNHHKLNYQYINPDKRDTDKIRSLKEGLTLKGDLSINEMDATKLPFDNNSFDYVLSISVIEHIQFEGDKEAIKEMWRILKPGGKLLLSFPVQKTFEDEYRNNNIYELEAETKNGKYFFQRFYDNNAITTRLLSGITNFEIVNKEVFGETEKGFFKSYEKKWIANGLSETVKDPYYISRYFKKFNTIDELPGIGVIGITLRKK